MQPSGNQSPKILTIAFATARGASEAEAYVWHLIRTCGLPACSVSVLPFVLNRAGLCRVYNEALRRADGQYLALVHDDLSFEKAQDWARTLIGVFENHPDYGMLGVAGSSILQESGLWYHEQVSCGHIYHRRDGTTDLTRYSLPHDRPLPAAALDGVFLMARTASVRDVVLDDELFDGFHFYDMELCMQARAKGVRLGVTDAVDLVHPSTGRFGKDWELYRQRFAERYRKDLPSHALGTSDRFPFRVFSRKTESQKSVAILIPTKDSVDLVRNAVAAIHNRTAPGIRYRIYVIDTGSSPASLAQLRALPDVQVIELGYYNFAAIHNDVILRRELIQEDLLLFHNNDVEFVNDALSHLLHAWETTPSPGVVGARLHFGNGLVQHAGMRVTTRDGRAVSAHHWGHQTLWNFGHDVRRGVTGNTFALALIERDLYRRLGGLSERYEACFEDAEINLRAILAGRSNVFAGDAVAIHYESLTRNQDAAKADKMQRDFARLAGFIEGHLPQLAPYLEALPAEARTADRFTPTAA